MYLVATLQETLMGQQRIPACHPLPLASSDENLPTLFLVQRTTDRYPASELPIEKLPHRSAKPRKPAAGQEVLRVLRG